MSKRPVPIQPTIVFIVMMLLVAPSAFLQGKNVPMWLFGIMCVAFVLTIIWSRLVLRKIQVRRIIQGPAKVGEPYVVRYEITNHAKRMAGFSIWIEETKGSTSTWQRFFRKARGWIMEVGGGETVHGESIFWPTKRGEAVFTRVKISTSFPFGMIRSSKTFNQEVHVLVQPQVFILRPSAIQAIVATGPLGRRSRRRGRGGDDYYGLREVTTNDRLGDISWKASAKRSELVCILRSKPAPPRIRVILDLTTPTDELKCEVDARGLEEQSISLCASVLTEAARQGQEIALTVLGCQTQFSPTLHSGTRHLGKLLSALAMIDLDSQRLPMPINPIKPSQQSGVVVIRPDRSLPIHSIGEAMYLTGFQLPELQKPLIMGHAG